MVLIQFPFCLVALFLEQGHQFRKIVAFGLKVAENFKGGAVRF